MSAVLDLIGSFIIGGLLLMMVLSVNTNVSQFSVQNGMELSSIENMAELTQEIEFDFRKIGYRAPNPSAALVRCDSTMIAFLADLDNNGTADSVVYSLGAPSQVGGTCNPRDRKLLRQVGAQRINSSLGLTSFRLRYFDAAGNLTSTPSAVKSIEVSLQVESPFAVDGAYAVSTWNTRIYPRNL
ncbi:MAG: hypothetical protein C4534_00500 [Gaiellales bacterium]|nr:MAG: hypothetical protein C4534_00500 [Gaiellales bacterium]